jgi:hypothetical protein
VLDDREGNFKPFRNAWFPVSLLDPAVFHQVLSNTALYLATLHPMDCNMYETIESVEHHSYAVMLTNRKLGNLNTALSDDSIIGTVLGFSIYYVRPPDST